MENYPGIVTVINFLVGLLIALVGYLAKNSFEGVEKRLERLERKLSESDGKQQDQKTTLTRIETLEGFISSEIETLKNKFDQLITEYKGTLDFIKENAKSLNHIIVKNDNDSK